MCGGAVCLGKWGETGVYLLSLNFRQVDDDDDDDDDDDEFTTYPACHH